MGKRKSGGLAGWTEYRYGSTKKPTVATIYNARRSSEIINQLLDIVADWRLTPFENEGPCRASIRTGLVLEGHRWMVADHQAAVLLAETFKRGGHARPSWQEGQRYHANGTEYCVGCSLPLDDDAAVRGQRFCSPNCAKRFLDQREIRDRKHDDGISLKAQYLIAKRKKPSRSCVHCAKEFHPTNTHGQECCSYQCAAVYRYKKNAMEMPIRQCEACGADYQPNTPKARYCSKKCGVAFRDRRYRAQRREARNNVIYLTPQIFDGWFREAA